jgi:CHAT domain-containing protein
MLWDLQIQALMSADSYVTTLQSLFQRQNNNGLASKQQQKLLSISQPQTPGQCALPGTIEEVDKVACVFYSSGLSKEDIICLSGSEAMADHVTCALDSCSCVHFACHGFQDVRQGMKSAFALHNGHLKLGQIASKRLSNALFTFLSACHAASGLKGLPGEAMQLAVGV